MTFWQNVNYKKKRIPLWLMGVVFGMLFLLVGFYAGQLEELYQKAVMICLECIGIG